MDAFDELNNNQLREELKSRGLGNFPVTDTTRNLLIKKLRNAVNGSAKASKGRRETISVVNHTEEPEINAEAKKPKPKSVSNRRTTIAAGAAPKTNVTNGKFTHPPNQSSCQFKVSFIPLIGTSVTTDAAKPVVAPPKSPSRRSVAPRVADSASSKYFADNSDDDLIAAAEAVENQTRNKRSSRSPSLSKSSVVTTSYKHIIEPLVESIDDDDEVAFLGNASDEEFNSNMLEKVRKVTPTTSVIAPVDRRKTMQLGPSVTTTTTTTSKPIEKFTSNEESISSYRRRYTTNTPIANRAPVTGLNSVNSDDDILSRVETPFLSNFTRRLAELKATPIAGLDDEFDDYKPKKSTYTASSYDYRSSAYPSRSSERFRERSVTTKPPQTVSAWSSFEKKIRKPLLVLLALFLIVFVYVFFFAENY